MIRKTNCVAVFVLTLSLFAALPSTAQGGSIDTTGMFSTANQSMWSTGPAFNFNASKTLDIPVNGSSTLSVGNLDDCSNPTKGTGFCLGLTTTGDFGATVGLNVNGGTVSATVPVNVTAGFPTSPVQTNTPLNLTSSAMFGTGSLTTASPSIQATGNLFVNNLGASISGAVGVDAFGVKEHTSGTLLSIGPFTNNAQIFSVNNSNLNKSIDLGFGVSLLVGTPFVATSGTGGPAGFPPALKITANGGPSNFLGLQADITDMVTSVLGLPPLHADKADFGCLAMNFAGTGINLGCATGSYTILDVTTALNLGATQAFKLSATPEVAYHIDEREFGSTVATRDTAMMPIGTPFNFSLPDGVTEAFVTPTYSLMADLMNNTGLELSLSAALQALATTLHLHAACNVPIAGCVGNFDPDPFGPLVNLNASLPLADISVFNSNFALGGWNSFQGQPFEISVAPEPGTLFLFGTGFLALASAARRKWLV